MRDDATSRSGGPDNYLNEKLDHYVQRALSDEDAMIYAFGASWGPEPRKSDQYFVASGRDAAFTVELPPVSTGHLA
jgi:uncharacterized protein YukJ